MGNESHALGSLMLAATQVAVVKINRICPINICTWVFATSALAPDVVCMRVSNLLVCRQIAILHSYRSL